MQTATKVLVQPVRDYTNYIKTVGRLDLSSLGQLSILQVLNQMSDGCLFQQHHSDLVVLYSDFEVSASFSVTDGPKQTSKVAVECALAERLERSSLKDVEQAPWDEIYADELEALEEDVSVLLEPLSAEQSEISSLEDVECSSMEFIVHVDSSLSEQPPECVLSVKHMFDIAATCLDDELREILGPRCHKDWETAGYEACCKCLEDVDLEDDWCKLEDFCVNLEDDRCKLEDFCVNLALATEKVEFMRQSALLSFLELYRMTSVHTVSCHDFSSHDKYQGFDTTRPGSWCYVYLEDSSKVPYVVHQDQLKQFLWILSAAIFKGLLF